MVVGWIVEIAVYFVDFLLYECFYFDYLGAFCGLLVAPPLLGASFDLILDVVSDTSPAAAGSLSMSPSERKRYLLSEVQADNGLGGDENPSMMAAFRKSR